MRRLLEMLVRSVATCALVAVPLAAAGADASPKTVLMLSSERANLPSIPDFERGLRSALADPGGGIEIFVEYFDFGRFPVERYGTGLVSYLRDRYGGRRLDVVVPFQDSAFEFVLAHRDELFPEVPVVAAGVERRSVEGRTLPAGITSIPVVYDYRRTLELALKLQPGAREALVVHGVSEYDLRRRDEALKALESFAPRLTYRALGGVPLAAIEDAVARLPKESVVLLVAMVRDAEGRSLVGRDYASRLARVSPAPIYGTFASHMERGTMGGAITDFTGVGRTAAIVVSRILAGNPPSRPVAIETPDVPLRVNWRALERWRVPPDRVPPDVQIAYRQPGVWDEHRNLVLTALAILLLQGILITGMLVQLRRRRRAESALRRSEEHLRLAAGASQRAENTLRLAIEALPTAVLMVNDQGRIVLANAQVERLLGYAPSELNGQAVEVLVPERFRGGHAAHRAGFFLAPQARPMAANRDLAARRKDGGEIPVEIGLNPIQSADGLLTLAAIVDLSQRYELRRKQHELEHIARVSTMGEIAASLAHELNQPLTAILSNAQAALRLLERPDVDQGEIREILRDVVADDKRAGAVIGTLRTMLRRGKTESRRMDLSNTVREVLALLHSELVGQHVEVEATLAAHSFVFADKTQTEQVLINLVMNGLDAMRQQPATQRKLTVTVSHTGGAAAQVAVRDSGTGIAGGDIDKVFDAFWTTKTLGMGMGLAVCRSIVESCGGRIWVERNRDRGVTFCFTLPLAAETQTA